MIGVTRCSRAAAATPIVSIGAAAYAAARIAPRAHLKVYPGAPHGLCSTHKDRVNADLLEFPADRRPIVTHKELLELRKQLNSLVGAYAHQSGKPHGVIHTELRRVCGGPPSAEATAGQLRQRIAKVQEWATRMK